MLLLLLCCLCFILEIRAEEAEVETVYHLKSRSVCLDVKGRPPYTYAKWIDERKNILTTGQTINPLFEKKIQYHALNATLCIKNLTETDSGVYTFSFDSNFTHVNNKYRIIVQDTVPKPALSITLEQVNASLGLCNFTVNCSVSTAWLWTECDSDGCQTQHKSFTQLNITVSSDNRTVTCAGNNHVSSQEDSQDIEDMCFRSGHQEVQKSDHLIYLKISVASILSVVTFIFVFFVAMKVFFSRRKTPPQVIQSQPVEQQPRVSTSSTVAEASYEIVDPGNLDLNSGQNEQSEKTTTIYCVLEPIPAPASQQEAEEKSHSEIHTVYSVIKKPEV